ncbi:MAG TPA: peptidylprolyl isomerase [Bacteroidales bacterium]|nr:peptidylprolyl isomerase [Bacteroidales bacterium]
MLQAENFTVRCPMQSVYSKNCCVFMLKNFKTKPQTMFRILRLLVVFFMLNACYGEPEQKISTDTTAAKEMLIESNKKKLKSELELIAKYVNDNKLDMQKTESGLWYKISKTTNDALISLGDKVSYTFKLSLLNGTVLYASNAAPKTIIAGKGGVESGLEEGLLMLNKGSKAMFILPPHLAHGIAGDNNKIPQRAIILYELEIIDVQ